jgi:hypothetical protein
MTDKPKLAIKGDQASVVLDVLPRQLRANEPPHISVTSCKDQRLMQSRPLSGAHPAAGDGRQPHGQVDRFVMW